MKIAQRFVFYGIGFAIGLVILFFFLGGKRTSCDYGPDARVLKNIRLKERVYSEESLNNLKDIQLDSSAVSEILKNGDVDFSESNTDPEKCKVYIVEGKVSEKKIRMKVENCEETATVKTVELIQ